MTQNATNAEFWWLNNKNNNAGTYYLSCHCKIKDKSKYGLFSYIFQDKFQF